LRHKIKWKSSAINSRNKQKHLGWDHLTKYDLAKPSGENEQGEVFKCAKTSIYMLLFALTCTESDIELCVLISVEMKGIGQ